MALWRMPTDYQFGQLSVAAAIGDTTIQSNAFANLPTNQTTTAVTPLVLHNPAAGTHEVVWVTAHTAAATSVTALRGKEGSSAQAWPSGTQWICAPTAARDGLSAYNAAALTAMTDQHVGMRALETDTSIVKEWTYGGGWQPEIGLCKPTDCGPTSAATSVPTAANILTRVGCVNSASPSSFLVAVTFAAPFPNGIIGAVANSLTGTQFIGAVNCESLTTTGMNIRTTQLNGGSPGLASLCYLAFGW